MLLRISTLYKSRSLDYLGRILHPSSNQIESSLTHCSAAQELHQCIYSSISHKQQQDQEATICTTQCILNNLEKRGEKAKREYEFAKSLTIVDCKHKDEPLSSYKCCCNIASCICFC